MLFSCVKQTLKEKLLQSKGKGSFCHQVLGGGNSHPHSFAWKQQKSPQCSKYLTTFFLEAILELVYQNLLSFSLNFWLFFFITENKLVMRSLKIILIDTYCGQLFWGEIGKRTWGAHELQGRAVVLINASPVPAWQLRGGDVSLSLPKVNGTVPFCIHAQSNTNLLSFSSFHKNELLSCLCNISISSQV